ncbi:MAG: CRISPR-associated endonuclease Cas2 [Chitinophagales bacterium]|nr:CRISPR-associated endonuclease Cas2 [Chitinophagales bacterium]HPR29884.1 CRISPR-associated endonuclease Cas2 [Chitinophagales bacterium]
MWVLVFFDLPTDKAADRKRYARFRKQLLESGFAMFQFSIYLRHCPSREHAETHINRVKRILPEKGNVGILCITDKQFGMMDLFEGKEETPLPATPQQLEIF